MRTNSDKLFLLDFYLNGFMKMKLIERCFLLLISLSHSVDGGLI